MENRTGSHTVQNLQVHIVWITKYQHSVLQGDIQLRCRELLRQTCNALDLQILKGVVSKDHIHLHLSYPPSVSISDIVKRLKGRSSIEINILLTARKLTLVCNTSIVANRMTKSE